MASSSSPAAAGPSSATTAAATAVTAATAVAVAAAPAAAAAAAPAAELEATQEVASNLCGILIGRGGSIISQMRTHSGARITISPGGQTATTRTICYTGTAGAIAMAQSLVAQQLQNNNAPPQALGAPSAPVPAGTAKRSNNPMSTQTETLQCPMTHIGGLIGKGGSVINQLRSQSGCRITIRDQRPGTMHRDVVVSGTRQQVTIGKALVAARMQMVSQEVGGMQQQQQFQQQQQMYAYSQQMVAPGGYPGMQQQQQQQRQQQQYGGHMARAPYGVPQHPGVGSSSTQVTIPNDMVGKLIGRGGETINRLKQQSGCEIQIAPEGAAVAGVPEGNRVVTLRGTPQALALAQQLMRAVLLGQ